MGRNQDKKRKRSKPKVSVDAEAPLADSTVAANHSKNVPNIPGFYFDVEKNRYFKIPKEGGRFTVPQSSSEPQTVPAHTSRQHQPQPRAHIRARKPPQPYYAFNSKMWFSALFARETRLQSAYFSQHSLTNTLPLRPWNVIHSVYNCCQTTVEGSFHRLPPQRFLPSRQDFFSKTCVFAHPQRLCAIDCVMMLRHQDPQLTWFDPIDPYRAQQLCPRLQFQCGNGDPNHRYVAYPHNAFEAQHRLHPPAVAVEEAGEEEETVWWEEEEEEERKAEEAERNKEVKELLGLLDVCAPPPHYNRIFTHSEDRNSEPQPTTAADDEEQFRASLEDRDVDNCGRSTVPFVTMAAASPDSTGVRFYNYSGSSGFAMYPEDQKIRGTIGALSASPRKGPNLMFVATHGSDLERGGVYFYLQTDCFPNPSFSPLAFSTLTQRSPVYAHSWAPDGLSLLLALDEIILYDVESPGFDSRSFKTKHRRMSAVAFGRDKNTVMGGGFDGHVRVFDCRTRGTGQGSIRPPVFFNTPSPVVGLHTLNDSHSVIVKNSSGTISVYDLRNPSRPLHVPCAGLENYVPHPIPSHASATVISPDGDFFVSGGPTNTVSVFSLKSPRFEHLFSYDFPSLPGESVSDLSLLPSSIHSQSSLSLPPLLVTLPSAMHVVDVGLGIESIRHAR